MNVYDVYSAATATNTLAAGTVVITGMTITPPAGTYSVFFDAPFDHTANGTAITIGIYVGGVLQTNSTRAYLGRGASRSSFTSACFAVVNGAQAIDVRWSTGANTASCYNRRLSLIRIK
jgi:hypothetical protein